MVRVRFAPSPTGALHIGGIRTALYNYIFAKKHGGKFVLRIEDTDRSRYVAGAEEYIIEALKWCGITPDEGVGFGEGEFAPYRQSERQAIYQQYAFRLVELGHAYFAFDTPEATEILKKQHSNFTYNHATRNTLHNSLNTSKAETQAWLSSGKPFVVRLKVEPGQDICVRDCVRGDVSFKSDELDDKVLLKADGMPTYHLANIIDDHLMQITHVIRGEEWLPSTAHHVLLYRGFGWEDTMPQFAHLPLILKPEGVGKLSKRDGKKLGIPVFPLRWNAENPEDCFEGFREAGFLPSAVINFLALLGWHPSGDSVQEIFSMDELIEQFDMAHITKSGARFNFEKAKWFNHKYIQALDNQTLATLLVPYIEKAGYAVPPPAVLESMVGLMKERMVTLHDFTQQGHYFFSAPTDYETEILEKKWNSESRAHFEKFVEFIQNCPFQQAHDLETAVKDWLSERQLKMGDYIPLLRNAIAGTTRGPAIFSVVALLGRQETVVRLLTALKRWK